MRVYTGSIFTILRKPRFFKLKYANVEDVNRAVTNIKSSKSKLIIDERTNTLIVVETPDAMKKVEKLVTELDVQVQTRVYQLKYTTPDVIEEIAKDVITKKRYYPGRYADQQSYYHRYQRVSGFSGKPLSTNMIKNHTQKPARFS